MVHDVGEGFWDVRGDLGERWYVASADLFNRLDRGLPKKEPTPCQHLPHDDAQAEEIGAGIDVLTPGLLGGHVAQLALDHAFGGEAGRSQRSRHAEVCQLHLTGAGDEDVLR